MLPESIGMFEHLHPRLISNIRGCGQSLRDQPRAFKDNSKQTDMAMATWNHAIVCVPSQ